MSVTTIRLFDFEANNYRLETERNVGIPPKIKALKELIDNADGIIISTPEYNSSIPAGLKNTIDWLSRIENKFLDGKPSLLMSTSNGGRGAQSALEHLNMILTYRGAQITGTFSLPRFGESLNEGNLQENQQRLLKEKLNEFEEAVLRS